jgi:molybdopterin molybdotransferase
VTQSSTASAPAEALTEASSGLPWAAARQAAYQTGRQALLEPVSVPLDTCDGATLADDLQPLTDLPAFPTSSIDGFAVRGPAPWRIFGRVLAGEMAGDLEADGTGMEIATGAMVPSGTTAILRVEESSTVDGLVVGEPRPDREWRVPGEEAGRGDVLMPAGSPVSPAIIGLAAACGHDRLSVRPRPKAVLLVFGDELLTTGPPAAGRIRDSLGPQMPAWLRRLGCDMVTPAVIGPIDDTLDAHVAAIREAQATGVDIILTTGGTMHGPVDHLHPALRELDAAYAVNTVEVRPGFPMLLATLPKPAGGTTLLAGLPGNPQSAVVALVTLVVPALLGMSGRAPESLPTIELGAPIPGRGAYTHLALVGQGEDGLGRPLTHTASSMLRGLAQSVGFAVIEPGASGSVGDRVQLVPLPLFFGERA